MLTPEERLEYMVNLALTAFDRAGIPEEYKETFKAKATERMKQAAHVWSEEVKTAMEE